MSKLTPDMAARLAEGAVDFVQKKFGFLLPYTPESLIVVDAVIDKVKETGATEQQASGILCNLGCYVGEVFVRHGKASWRRPAELRMTVPASAIVVSLPGLTACDVIAKVFERFRSGASLGVAALFETHFRPELEHSPTRAASAKQPGQH